MKTFPIDVSIITVQLILTKLRWFLFSRYGQTDAFLETSYGNIIGTNFSVQN